MSAKKLYEELIASGIVGATGETHFKLHGLTTLVQDSSIVGNVIQEWVIPPFLAPLLGRGLVK